MKNAGSSSLSRNEKTADVTIETSGIASTSVEGKLKQQNGNTDHCTMLSSTSPAETYSSPSEPLVKKAGSFRDPGIRAFTNMGRKIAAKWKGLDAQTKAYYNGLAHKEKVRQKQAVVDWKKQCREIEKEVARKNEEGSIATTETIQKTPKKRLSSSAGGTLKKRTKKNQEGNVHGYMAPTTLETLSGKGIDEFSVESFSDSPQEQGIPLMDSLASFVAVVQSNSVPQEGHAAAVASQTTVSLPESSTAMASARTSQVNGHWFEPNQLEGLMEGIESDLEPNAVFPPNHKASSLRRMPETLQPSGNDGNNISTSRNYDHQCSFSKPTQVLQFQQQQHHTQDSTMVRFLRSSGAGGAVLLANAQDANHFVTSLGVAPAMVSLSSLDLSETSESMMSKRMDLGGEEPAWKNVGGTAIPGMNIPLSAHSAQSLFHHQQQQDPAVNLKLLLELEQLHQNRVSDMQS